ncbi:MULTISPECIES: hypothetical protein [unclassified Pyramidobacter]|uniref:hypothetical protein n=1 Tax=unclassified Pyramidobacter TaxID=2632171 RepID=UPI0013159254|nr:hypothetical protein [Pyramidobacter sp. CG50-2]
MKEMAMNGNSMTVLYGPYRRKSRLKRFAVRFLAAALCALSDDRVILAPGLGAFVRK